MKHLRYLLLVLGVIFSIPAFTQNIVVNQAEFADGGDGVGSDWQQASDGVTGDVYLETFEPPALNASAPDTPARVLTFVPDIPADGSYNVFLRVYVGPNGGADDSFFFPATLGSLDPSNNADWVVINNILNGFINEGDVIDGTGDGIAGMWMWIDATNNYGGTGPYTMSGGPNTFQIGAREDGIWLDKVAWVEADSGVTVGDLDAIDPPVPLVEVQPFDPSGLEPMAASRDKFVGGVCCGNQGIYLENYFNQITPENAGKWGSVEGTQDEYDWSGVEEAVDLANANGFPMRYHVLVWGNQQPEWIADLAPAEQLAEVTDWIQSVANLPYIDTFKYVEVVNEPVNDPPDAPDDNGQGGNYIDALGGATDWAWARTAFEIADDAFNAAFEGSGIEPPALMVNEYGVLSGGDTLTQYLGLIDSLIEDGTLDAIGVQGHAFSTTGDEAAMVEVLDQLAERNLPIQITEMDIDGPDDAQLLNYQRIFPALFEHPAVEGITLWGYRLGHWRTAEGANLVLDNALNIEKPALVWLRNYLSTDLPVISGSLSVSQQVWNRSVIGVAPFTDSDGGLHDYAIVGGTGDELFEIHPVTGEITILDRFSLDAENDPILTLELEVRDKFLAKGTGTLFVNVTATAPSDNSPDELYVGVGDQVSIDLNTWFPDPDGDPVTITSDDLPSGFSIENNYLYADSVTESMWRGLPARIHFTISDGMFESTGEVIIYAAPTNNIKSDAGVGSVNGTLFILLSLSAIFSVRRRFIKA